MQITGVRVTRPDGTEKVYQLGRSFDYDGWGDLIIRDQDGVPVATRKRPSVEEVEVIAVGPAGSDDGA